MILHVNGLICSWASLSLDVCGSIQWEHNITVPVRTQHNGASVSLNSTWHQPAWPCPSWTGCTWARLRTRSCCPAPPSHTRSGGAYSAEIQVNPKTCQRLAHPGTNKSVFENLSKDSRIQGWQCWKCKMFSLTSLFVSFPVYWTGNTYTHSDTLAQHNTLVNKHAISKAISSPILRIVVFIKHGT